MQIVIEIDTCGTSESSSGNRIFYPIIPIHEQSLEFWATYPVTCDTMTHFIMAVTTRFTTNTRFCYYLKYK